MRLIVLTRSVAGAVGALFFLSTLASAQMESYGVGVNRVYYRWSNVGSVAPGDTLRVRRLQVNTTNSVIDLPVHPCEFRVVTSADVRFLGERCSEQVTDLAPGDSTWAEKRWLVRSAPGRYDFELRVPTERGGAPARTISSGSWTIVQPERRRAAEPKARVPVVLRFSRTPDALSIARREVESAVRHVISKSGYLPLLVSGVAADAMAEMMPYLILTVELSGDGRYSLSRCWIGEDGERRSRLCDSATTGGSQSPVLFGLRIADFVERELKWVRKGGW